MGDFNCQTNQPDKRLIVDTKDARFVAKESFYCKLDLMSVRVHAHNAASMLQASMSFLMYRWSN